MKHFPAICIDNFYSNPDEIRKFALSQEFTSDTTGKWPGKRTKPLHLIDENLFQLFSNKLFSVFFDASIISSLKWQISTEFHLIENLDSDKESIKNTGWVHYDDGYSVLAGVIYLNPEAPLDSGTSLFKCVDEETLTNFYENGLWTNVKKKFYLEGNDEGYNDALIQNNNAFVETARFQNIYNRLVMYDGDVPHRFNSCFLKNEPRLVQVFFVSRLEGNFESPMTRIKNFPV